MITARGDLVRVLPLLRHPRYEVFPAANIEQAVLDWVPRGVTVTVTASPAQGLDATLDLTARLAAHGYQVVPHLPARLVRDDAHLTAIVDQLLASGITDVFVPAGDADPPVGGFDSCWSGPRPPWPTRPRPWPACTSSPSTRSSRPSSGAPRC
jgi:hypothetical protein